MIFLKKELQKFIQNKNITEEEKKEIVDWILKSPSNQKIYNKLKAEEVVANLQAISSSKNHVIKLKTVSKNKLYRVSLAASFLLLLLGGFFFFTYLNVSFLESTENVLEDNFVTVTTKKGEQYKVLLKDGTSVILNSDSKLIYPKKFSNLTRKITLEGEAFFDVAHNPKKPFIVKTTNLNIRVLGTTFNVKSYKGDKTIQTTLVSGKVEIEKKKDVSKLILKPSQRAIYNKDEDSIILDKVITNNIISWKSGKLIFNKTPFLEVLADLERNYNVSFEVKSEKLLDYNYTGSFDNLKIEEILEALKISSPIYYTNANAKIYIYMK